MEHHISPCPLCDGNPTASLNETGASVTCKCGLSYFCANVPMRIAIDMWNTRPEEILQGDLIAKQGELLRGIANVLKGEPEPLHCHDNSDLEEVAKSMMKLLNELLTELGNRTAEAATKSVPLENRRRKDYSEKDSVPTEQYNVCSHPIVGKDDAQPPYKITVTPGKTGAQPWVVTVEGHEEK